MKAVNMASNESEESKALNLAIDQLYSVFSGYRAPEGLLDVCTHCCMDHELENEMRKMPLRQLTIKHFYGYNDTAKSEVQPVEELKYLLPRMLELVANGAEIHHSSELYLQRLGNCEAGAFSTVEYESIKAFALAYFARCLSQHPWQAGEIYFVAEAFDSLLMFDIAGMDLQPMLECWLKKETTMATLHYVSAGFDYFWQIQSMQNAFAKDRPVFQEVLKTWLTNENNRRMFARRILELDMSAIDQTPICYYGSQINVKQMTETVFDLISY